MDKQELTERAFKELLEYWTEIYAFQNIAITNVIERLNSIRRINANMIVMMENLSDVLEDNE